VEWAQTGNDETYEHAWQRVQKACAAEEGDGSKKKKGTNVVVAVRLRPFNKRENFLESKSVVECDRNTVRLITPASSKADSGKDQSFNFDYVFDSFDSDSSSFANQQVVFETVGIDLLVNAWCGYNVSIFAYGQTGSGKSYSMQGAGSGSDLGIIPRLCEYLFYLINRKDQEAKDADASGTHDGGPVEQLELQVDASYVEVYNEKLFDLLVNPESDSKPPLKIREHPKTGVYVEGLTLEPVDCYNDLSLLMNEGMQNRTIAATNMNATSSRSHCIFTLHFIQRRTQISAAAAAAADSGSPVEEPEVVCKVAKINLVDLAGSEDSRRTGAEGKRLQEGGNINKSLLTIGQCIKALSDNSAREAQHHVPYRNSTLTQLLRESLGGNAKLVMLAALSPADENFSDTLSTLRYASSAKRIVTKAVINESPANQLIQELRAEIEKLKAEMKNSPLAGQREMGPMVGVGPDGRRLSLKELGKAQIAQIAGKRKMSRRATMSDIAQLTMHLQKEISSQKLASNAGMRNLTVRQRRKTRQMLIQKSQGHVGEAQTTPHLANMNEDPSLDRTLLHFLPRGLLTRFGHKNALTPQTVSLSGGGVQPEHCTIEHTQERRSPSPFEAERTVSPTGSVTAAPGSAAAAFGAISSIVGGKGAPKKSFMRRQSADDSPHGQFTSSLRGPSPTPKAPTPPLAPALPRPDMGSLLLTVLNSQSSTYRNGKRITPADGAVELQHGDRLVLGNGNHLYTVVIPQVAAQLALNPTSSGSSSTMSYSAAVREFVTRRTETEAERQHRLMKSTASNFLTRRHQQRFEDELVMAIRSMDEANEMAIELQQPIRFRILLEHPLQAQQIGTLTLKSLISYQAVAIIVVVEIHRCLLGPSADAGDHAAAAHQDAFRGTGSPAPPYQTSEGRGHVTEWHRLVQLIHDDLHSHPDNERMVPAALLDAWPVVEVCRFSRANFVPVCHELKALHTSVHIHCEHVVAPLILTGLLSPCPTPSKKGAFPFSAHPLMHQRFSSDSTFMAHPESEAVDIFAALFHAQAGTGDALSAARTAAHAAGADPCSPKVRRKV
jgi:hypothetical protein